MFNVGQKVKFKKVWADKVKPNFGYVSDRPSETEGHIWVWFDVPEVPPDNVLLVPLDKLEISK